MLPEKWGKSKELKEIQQKVCKVFFKYCILKKIIRQMCDRKVAGKQKKRARLDEQGSYIVFSIKWQETEAQNRDRKTVGFTLQSPKCTPPIYSMTISFQPRLYNSCPRTQVQKQDFMAVS